MSGIVLGWAAVIVGVGGIVLLATGMSRLYHLRIVAGCGHCTLGAALTALGAAAAATGLHLHTYDRLTHERPVMEIRFVEKAPREFTVLVYPEDSPAVRRYTLHGDEWQLDARILRWSGPALLGGLDSLYRLERLSGRYRDVASERSLERSVHALAADGGIDLWALAREHQRWLPFIDTVYGNATYLPMIDDARYQVIMTQTGLLARPVNPEAQQAVERWR